MNYLLKLTVTKYNKSEVFLFDALKVLVENQSIGSKTNPIKIQVFLLSGLCTVFPLTSIK